MYTLRCPISLKIKACVLFVLVALVHSLFVVPAFAKDFTVDATCDAVDTNPGDGFCMILLTDIVCGGRCTIRAAIQESNALGGIPAVNYDGNRSSCSGRRNDTFDVVVFIIESERRTAPRVI